MNYSKKTTNFFEDVYDVVRLIPPGKVTSYGAIAKYLGSSGSSRMVGWAMNAAHNLDDVPAYRVVNRTGLLTGRNHFDNPYKMEEMLVKEGVSVNENQVTNFSKHYWDPSIELAL